MDPIFINNSYRDRPRNHANNHHTQPILTVWQFRFALVISANVGFSHGLDTAFDCFGMVHGKSLARKKQRTKKAAVFYAVQLFMNVFWMVLFFQWHIYLLSFFWLLALTLTAANMVEKFRIVSEAAANIQIPYIAWLVYALYFNFGVYLLNGAPVSL